MSSRQLADGVFLHRSLVLPPTYPRPALLSPARPFSRLRAALSSELRHSITVENVPNIVLEWAFAGRLSRKSKTIVSTLEELLVYVPPQMLVWKHYCDLCVVLPLSKCLSSFPSSSSLDGSTHSCGLSPDFSAERKEIFVPLRPSPDSQDYVEVVSPFPGEGPTIDPSCYPPFRLTCAENDFMFPPVAAKSHEDDDEEGEDSDGHTAVELRGIKKVDPGAAVMPGSLSVGDMQLVRGHVFGKL